MGAAQAAGGAAGVTVWDTHYIPPNKAFRVYRDALCSVYMPWTARTESAADFQGRFESVSIRGGSLGRSRCSPMVCTRTRTELAHSEDELFYALYVLSGYHACEQNGRSNRANAGEILLLDSSQPCRIETGDPPYEVLCIGVPKAQLRGIDGLEDRMGNAVVKWSPLAAPLFDCANLIASKLSSGAQEELEAVYDACSVLMPLAVRCFDDEHGEGASEKQNSVLLRTIKAYVANNAADPGLCPQEAADHFGISVRYVHKLFARSGTTFGAYVSAVRLDNIRHDLLSPSWSHRQIADLAFRWGFSDLSTFNRSFKRRFGCAPSQFRAK